MKGPSQWLRPVHGSLLGLVVGLGVAFVLAVGLGAGIAIVTQQGSLPLPEGAEPLQADATTTSTEDTRRKEVAEISGPSEGAEEAPTGDHNVGVWYVEEDQRWAIFNQDLAPMARGTSFDVHALSDEEAFVHRATAENTAEDGTYLNDPLTNANPDVPLSVTQNWNPGGVGGTYNDHPVGVRYDADVRQWVIFNEDGEEVPEGAAFNVTVFPLGEPTFVQRATSGNITQNWTSIDDPLVNGDPNAILIAIPRQREG